MKKVLFLILMLASSIAGVAQNIQLAKGKELKVIAETEEDVSC